ncbi:MAG: WxcM-like domain-containing protein [Marinifilaceae bacterium]
MSEIKVIPGEVFNDHRGMITSLNTFDFEGVERFYFIHHPDKKVVRGWHGHQFEKKWFYCVKGSFQIAIVEPDNWDEPSHDLEPEMFALTEEDSKIVCVPAGRANCIKATTDGSVLLVYSGKKMPEALDDSWRYDNTMWVDWSQYE